jgi:hypothetical protein
MTTPRHLWSGDWERDSAARAEELASRARLQIEQPAPEPALAPAREPASPGAGLAAVLRALVAALMALLRAVGAGLRALGAGLRRLQPRAVLLAALVAAIVVGAAFGLSALVGGGPPNFAAQSVASLREADALLGVQLSTPPNGGVVIATLEPGGPAELAQLDPGDVVSAVGNHPIEDAADIADAFRHLQPGSQVTVQVSRGSSIIATRVSLAGHP